MQMKHLLEKRREYDRKRRNSPKRKEYMRAYLKEYSKLDKQREWRRNYIREYIKLPHAQARRKNYMKEYRKGKKYRESYERYKNSNKYKEYARNYLKEYKKTPKWKAHIKEYNKKYHKTETYRAYKNNYRKRGYVRSKLNLYQKNRYKNDPNFKLRLLLSFRIQKAIKRASAMKNGKTIELVGAAVGKVREYLQAKFREGMSWDNYGKWHIDHIRPLASFDLADPKEQKRAFHYTNLQPLWEKENKSKGSKYEGKIYKTI